MIIDQEAGIVSSCGCAIVQLCGCAVVRAVERA